MRTRLNADDMANDENYHYMDLAMEPVPAEELAVNDFAVCLLTMLGYVPRSRMARTRADIPLIICGEPWHAKTDVCIVDENDILFLVQEDKGHKERKDPEPQLIAAAIADQQHQTNACSRSGWYQYKVMVGHLGRFFASDVLQDSEELARAVERGRFPATPTISPVTRRLSLTRISCRTGFW